MTAFYNNKYGLGTLLIFLSFTGKSQVGQDSIKTDQRWNLHFQSTVLNQYHPGFHSAYQGENSLDPKSESHTALSGTLFVGARLWKGAEACFNPEISGGQGFSKTTGIAGFPNGEVYRVSDAAPRIYVARLFLKQIFSLSDRYELIQDNINQIAARRPTSYLAVSVGKFSVMDFLDNNRYSHDPRTQFFNWSLMGNGAWDYPANTRGYTYGLVVEFVKPTSAIRFSMVMVPTTANGSKMDADLFHARSNAIEFEHKYMLCHQQGTIRLMSYLTQARMGNYREALDWGVTHHKAPEIDSVQSVGRTKLGCGVNIEQPINRFLGAFFRASWNDGRNETWAFTEIDHHVSAGMAINGSAWKRGSDNIGIAQIVNGISREHSDYLKSGGCGIIIGDGNLNYGNESITEIYYSFKFPFYNLWLTPDYQFIVNPAYNKDRGPVHCLGLRMHLEI